MISSITSTANQPVVTHDMTPNAPKDNANRPAHNRATGPAPTPARAQLQKSQEYIKNMVGQGLAAKGLKGLDGKIFESLNATPMGKIPKKAQEAYAAMLDAATECDTKSQRFAKMSLSDFQNPAKKNENFSKLEDFTSAQHKLYAAIQAFQKVYKKAPAMLNSIAQNTQARASEAMNLYYQAKNTTSFPASTAQNMTAQQGMQKLAPTMHGSGTVINTLATKANDLVQKIDQSVARSGAMTPAAFTQEVNSLQTAHKELMGQLDAVMHPKATKDSHRHMADEGVFEPVKGLLEHVEKRLDALLTTNPREGVVSAAAAILPDLTPQELARVKTAIRNNPFTQTFTPKTQANFSKLIDNYVENRALLLQYIKEGSITPHECHKVLNHLKTNAVANIVANFSMLWAVDKQNPRYDHALADICAKFPKRISSSAVSKQENAEVKHMFQRITQAPHQTRSEYIQAALKHELDMGLVVEASLRNIPTSQLDLEANDKVLVSSKKLGAGGVNTVAICTYKQPDGNIQTRIFKPEVNARRGLERLTLNTFGYANKTRSMQLNIASYKVADAIGCGGVMTKSSIGMHDGQLGLFMEKADGVTARNKNDYDAFRLANGRKCSFDTLYASLTPELKNTVRANLMQELNKLEWADALSGQGDRHADNYLFNVNPTTGAVTVTGIDNDASFGQARVGLTRIDISKIGTFDTQDALRNLANVKDQRINVINFERVLANPKATNQLRNLTGLNRFGKPTLIDKKTYDALMLVNEQKYRQSLIHLMDSDAVDAAVSRLKDAKAHAKALHAEHKVIDDWASPETLEKAKEINLDMQTRHSTGKSFFYSSFENLL